MTALLTPAEAAERLQISERTLMAHVDAQDLAAIHVGRGRLRRRLRFDPADLAAFNERRKVEAEAFTRGPACRSTNTKARRSGTMTSSIGVSDFMARRERLRGRQRSE